MQIYNFFRPVVMEKSKVFVACHIVHLVSLIAPKRIEPITWDWSHFEDILKENMVNLLNKWWGAPRGPHRGPKGPKMDKTDQNLELFRFCHHPFHSGKDFSLLLHWFNAERVVENERREWKPLRAQQGGSKGPRMAKIDQNLVFFKFCSHPNHSGNKLSLFLCWSYAGRV